MAITISIPLNITATLEVEMEEWEAIKNNWADTPSEILSEAEVDEMAIWDALKDARDNLSATDLMVWDEQGNSLN